MNGGAYPNLSSSQFLTNEINSSYIFDALVNFPVLALFVWYHPARYLPYFGFRLLKDAR